MIVKLETKHKEFVTWAVLLPFNEIPDVVYWGTRIFVYDLMATEQESAARIPVFKEAFATPAMNFEALAGLPQEIDELEIMTLAGSVADAEMSKHSKMENT